MGWGGDLAAYGPPCTPEPRPYPTTTPPDFRALRHRPTTKNALYTLRSAPGFRTIRFTNERVRYIRTVIRERLGPLPHSDPAHSVLVRHVFPQLGVNGDRARIRAYRLGGSNAVFEYEDRESGAKVIGKFYGRPGIPASGAITNRMLREFRAIERMRGIGLDGHPHQVMRAFAAVPEIGGALFLEHLEGETLGVVLDAVAKGKQSSSDLYGRLTALAYFLATMHNRTAREEPVAFATDVKYLRKLSRTLRELGHLGESGDREFRALGERWMGFGPMWEDRKVLLHGDATPANFLFRDGMWVGGIDFERSHFGDRSYDVGRIAGELQHAFLRNRGSRRAAEPFIGHFLWEYACHFPDRHDAFAHICARIPFHLATTLLRIARNEWVADDYRAVLLDSARDALSSVGR